MRTHALLRILLFVIGAAFVNAFATPFAYAKEIKLQWEPIEDSIRYVLEIQGHSGDKKKRVLTLKKNKWEGDLPFGIYTYRVHAVDQVERPGEWSAINPLVVMPTSPQPLVPENGSKISILEKDESKIFKWKSIPQVQEYQVEVTKEGTPILSRKVTSAEVDLSELGPGEYTWTIRPVLKAPDRAPASLAGRHWEGQASEPAHFEIAFKKLDEPEVISPVGHIPPPPSGKLRFQWKKVPDAKLYEVTLEKDQTEGAPSSAPKTYRVSSNAMIADVPEMGSYRWKVRALASVRSVVSATSEATANFNMNPSDPGGKSGYIGFSTLFAPYKYGVQNAAGSGSLDSQSMTLRLTGEKWLKQGWGLGGGIQNTFSKIQGENHSWMDIEVFGKYYVQLPKSFQGLLLLPKAGFEQRQYLFFTPDGTTATASSIRQFISKKATTLGPALGFDLRKQFGERWSVGLKMNYFKPLILSGVESGSTISGATNLSVGLQGFYWRSPTWGFGVGAFFDRRSFSYTSPTSGTQGVNLDSTQLFASILLRI